MSFKRYPHLEKFGNQAVENIEFGTCYIFPKLDGTNASVWNDGAGNICSGSRNRTLSLQSDNQGFCEFAYSDLRLIRFCMTYTSLILYGEWLVPHTIKNYREDAWRKFYVFDVFDRTTGKFLPYDTYAPMMAEYGIDYIPCIKIFKNPSWENLMHEAKNCKFLLANANEPDAIGEGIVIKNYDWVNYKNEVTWAKIVLAEFKDKHVLAMGPGVGENKTAAQVIADNACTGALIDKEYAKIVNDVGGWTSRYIPRLLHTVFYSVVTEELWDQLKVVKYGLVNFKELQQLCILKVKQHKPELF